MNRNCRFSGYLLLFLVIFVLFSQFSRAQDNKLNNNIFFEILGNAGAYSLNYDRIIFGDASLRAGIMVAESNNNFLLVYPVLINYRFNIGQNFLEIGIGKTYYNLTFETKVLGFIELKDDLLTSVISYRLQIESGINLRIAFTPFYYERKFIPFGGFSIGYSF